jgi:hypothetical protein
LTHTERKNRLEARLLGFQPLWRPQPFKIETPDWCGAQPALTSELLALGDREVDRLNPDNAALIALLAGHVPELAELAELIEFPVLAPASRSSGPAPAEGRMDGDETPRPFTDIPGRKHEQIEAYAAAIGKPHAPLLEWCSGKGHLGRLLASRWQRPVASLEIDSALCEAGQALARRAKLDHRQHFIRADALAQGSTRPLAGRHAVALHACGDLHTRLIAGAVEHASPAVDVAPCCYYRIADETYRPFTATALELTRDDLRLAVTETSTASAKQRRRSRRALAWKLGWVELRKALTGEAEYRPFPPVPEPWLRGDFAGFVERMAGRAGLGSVMPAQAGIQPDEAGFPPTRERRSLFSEHEALGHARAARMLRLQLVRLAFRRPLEVWLIMDMAVHLETQGYAVTVGAFCDPTLTPRNLLLSARKM